MSKAFLRFRFRTAFLFACVLILSISGRAQEHPHAPHERLGNVHFATSCSPDAQQEFDRAVALLHSFEFSRAIAAFNATLENRPDLRDGLLGHRPQPVE